MKFLNKIDEWWVKNKYGVVYHRSEKILSWFGTVFAWGGIIIMIMALLTDEPVFKGASLAFLGIMFVHMVQLKALRRRTLELLE